MEEYYNVNKKLPVTWTYLVDNGSDFALALKHYTAEQLTRPENRSIYQEAQHALDMGGPLDFDDRVDFMGTCIDALIPHRDDTQGLLTFAVWDESLLKEEPEGGYSTDNEQSPAALLQENIYRRHMTILEDEWEEVMAIAQYVINVRRHHEPPKIFVGKPDEDNEDEEDDE